MSATIRIVHRTGYSYAGGVTASFNEIRMLPRSTHEQQVVHSRIDISPVPWTYTYTDYWGTTVTAFEVFERHESLNVVATSTVDVQRHTSEEPRLQWGDLTSLDVTDTHCEMLEIGDRVAPPPDLLAAVAELRRTSATPWELAVAVVDLVHASVTVCLTDGRLPWQTSLARQLLRRYFEAPDGVAPQELLLWVQQAVQARLSASTAPAGAPPTWFVNQANGRLTFTLHQQTGDEEWLLVMSETSDQAAIEALTQEFTLTAREGEVLYWVVRGKTNRDIGDILGSSPATVKKQMEHIFQKLGVETRTAAAGLALSRVSQLKMR